MIATLSRPYVRDRQRLDYAGLQVEAAKAARGLKQADLAADLGVTPPAISQALAKIGAPYAALQRRIIEALTDYTIREERPEPVFRVERKGEG